jgi:anti-anti-sigma factor
MHYTLDKHEKHAVLKIHEQKLNTLISAELKSELLILNSQGFINIILELTDCSYCDSSGLSAILVGNRICRNANGTFIICGLSDAIKKLVSISQLEQVLTIASDLNAATDIIMKSDVTKNSNKE